MKRIALTFVLLVFVLSCSIGQESLTETNYESLYDVVYKKTEEQDLKLNLFLPYKDGKRGENVPLLLWMDSGCWHSGIKAGNGGFWASAKALEKGFAVASVTHRSLNRGAHFPDQIEDVRAAVRYLRAHAKEYGLDPNRFAASGGSSGGHLSLMLGVSDNLFDVGENLEYSGQVNCIVEFYGPTAQNHWFKAPPFPVYGCIYLVFGVDDEKPFSEQLPELLPKAIKYAPITYVDKETTPTLLIHGVNDRLVPVSQSVLFYEALQAAGVRTQLVINNTGIHSLDSLGSVEDLAKLAFDFIGWKP